MGLAASQAKFLAITSRKANCEYRTTELAQQRLSYTRELDNISKEYQDALNSTMLVWDADGSGDYRYQLSYDIMMSPSDYNQYTPYLVSRQDGKIAFDDNMMKAIAKWAKEKNIECKVSLENKMACGLGACLCCVEETNEGNVRVCVDGPVFDTRDLKW